MITRMAAERVQVNTTLQVVQRTVPVLQKLRVLDEDFEPQAVTDVSSYVEAIGERLYQHAFVLRTDSISEPGDYARLFQQLVQHAGLVREFTGVNSLLDREHANASIQCWTETGTYASQWRQHGATVAWEFLDFANATLAAVGRKKHVILPGEESPSQVSMICVGVDDYHALDDVMRIARGGELELASCA